MSGLLGLLRPTPNALVGIAAVLVAALLFAWLRSAKATATTTLGLWYEDILFTLPRDATDRLGGPLTRSDIDVIERISRRDLEQAFAGLRIAVTPNPDAFWRLGVLQDMRSRGALPNAGQSFGLGPLGGVGALSFVTLAANGVHLAPPGASRETMIEGIGRGIGRAAAHEFMHQILGTASTHNQTDRDSYEYPNSSRASQYYGDLHWTTAWPLLHKKLGQ